MRLGASLYVAVGERLRDDEQAMMCAYDFIANVAIWDVWGGGAQNTSSEFSAEGDVTC